MELLPQLPSRKMPKMRLDGPCLHVGPPKCSPSVQDFGLDVALKARTCEDTPENNIFAAAFRCLPVAIRRGQGVFTLSKWLHLALCSGFPV